MSRDPQRTHPAPVTLAWRQPAPAAAALEAGRELSPAAVPARALPEVAVTPAAMRTAAAAAVLEPALVERLTDDVVRRLERRVRIERERRGL